MQRLVYVAADNHVHELSFDGAAWSDEDASLKTGRLAILGVTLGAYRTDLTGTRHIIVVPDGVLTHLRRDFDGWHSEDIGMDGNLADAGTRPAGLALGSGTEYVFYTSINFQVIALIWPTRLVILDPLIASASRTTARER